MAKGGPGSGATSPGGPPLSQEISNLRKTIEEKNKGIAELKAKLEAQEKIINSAVSTHHPT